MNSNFNQVIAVLNKFGIEHEHHMDDEDEDDPYEFIEIHNSDLQLTIEEFTDGIYYSIEEHGCPPVLSFVTEQCFCAVVGFIIKDHSGRLQ